MKPHPRNRAGMGLIDSLIAISLLGVVMTSAATAIRGGQQLFESGMSRSQVEVQMVRTLGRIREALYTSERGTVAGVAAAPFFQDELVFQRPESFDYATGTVVTREARVSLQRDPGELDDGIDNDHDGLVDECRALLTLGVGTPEEETIVLCSGISALLEGELPNGLDDNGNGMIDEPGLCFDRDGEELNVHLSLEGRDRIGNRWVRTLDSTVLFRN